MFSYPSVSKWITDGANPLIALEASQSAEDLCISTGLTVLQLLQPFGKVDGFNYIIHSDGHDVSLKGITVEMMYGDHLYCDNAERVEKSVKECLITYQPSNEAIQRSLIQIKSERPIEAANLDWIITYMSVLRHSLRCTPNNLLYHPLGVLLVVGSNDPDPIRRFDELSQRYLQRDHYVREEYSKSIPFFYILLHDSQSNANAESIFRSMKSTFVGSQCKLFPINSLPASEQRGMSPAPFCFQNKVSCCLSMSDSNIKTMAETIASIINRSIFQNVDKLLSVYREDINSSRRGITNVLFSWLRSGSSSNLATNKNVDIYNSSTIEFKIRFVADMLFLFQDYTTAIEYYKLVLEDYRNNNTSFQSGEACLQIALCYFLCDEFSESHNFCIKSVISYLKQALQEFREDKTERTHYHCFYTASLYAMLLGSQVIDGDTQIVSITDLYTALLSPLGYLPSSIVTAVVYFWAGALLKTQKKRKHAHCFVLAETQLKKWSMWKWCLWCILCSWCSDIESWKCIYNYVSSELQFLLLQENSFDISVLKDVQSFLYSVQASSQRSYVHSSSQPSFQTSSPYPRLQQSVSLPSLASLTPSPSTHQHIPQVFFSCMETLQATQCPYTLANCQIPLIHSSLSLQYQENPAVLDQECWPYLSDNRGFEMEYEDLLCIISRWSIDSSAIPHFPVESINGRRTPTLLCKGQEIVITAVIENPLREAIPISDMYLETDWEKKEDYAVSHLSILLLPHEKKSVSLSFKSHISGTFSIKQIHFVVSGMDQKEMHIIQDIELKGRRLNKSMTQKRSIVYGENNALTINVSDYSLLMSFQIQREKKSYCFSELSKIPLLLKNEGERPITNIVVFTENYHWFIDQRDKKDINCFSSSPVVHIPSSQQYSLLPINGALMPQKSLEICSYLHFPEINNTSFIKEENEGYVYSLLYVVLYSDDSGNWRMIRGKEEFTVQPLVYTKTDIVEVNQQTYLQCKIENVSAEAWIHSIVLHSICPYCHIYPIYQSEDTSIASGSAYLTLVRLGKEVEDSAEPVDLGVLQGIYSNPIYEQYCDFIKNYNTTSLRLERLNCVPKYSQRDHRFVDVVWNMELLDEETGENTYRTGYIMCLFD